MITSHLAAAAIVENNEGKILMVQEGKNHIKGTWNFPGGSCEEKEEIEETVKREVLEETGWTVELNELIGIYLEESVRTQKTVTVFMYRAKLVEQKHQGLENGEILKTEFFRPEKIIELDLRKENRKRMLKDFLQDRGFSKSRIVDTRN